VATAEDEDDNNYDNEMILDGASAARYDFSTVGAQRRSCIQPNATNDETHSND